MPTDDSAPRLTELRYRDLVEQLPAISYIASLDASLSATYISPQIAGLGFAQREWLADPELWAKQLHPDDRERVLAAFAQGIAQGGPIACEYRLLDCDGRPRWFKDRAVVVLDRAGRPIAIQGVMLDIEERKRHEAEAAHAQAQLRALGQRLESIREDERARVAREVHDELGQSLTGLKMDLALLGADLPPEAPAAARLAAMDELVSRTIDAVRRIAYELRPAVLDTLGLVAAIEWQTLEFERKTGIRCELVIPQDEPQIGAERAAALFRIYQEILTNIARHAGATQVDVCFTLPAGNLLLEVADNGRGFDAADAQGRASLGLLGMRERAGEFGGIVDIVSHPGRGTRITVAVPLRPAR